MKFSHSIFLSVFLIGSTIPLNAADTETVAKEILPYYYHIHENPELSLKESETAAILAKKLSDWGYKVISPIGGTGLVGILKNGSGKTILIRADMDALPVEEDTGLPYASTKRMVDAWGEEQPVMHACGHDMHMAVWLGTAKYLAQTQSDWSGTLVFLAQPGEEYGDGARKMLDDGLFKRIPLPDLALALHVSATLPAGKVGITSGYAYSNVDAMEIKVKGVGGHGAYPHATIDPIIISSRLVLALQTLVSREISPLEPVVVTVGAINGGTKGNVIPDEVTLKLTLRYHNVELRPKLIEGIRRIANGIAQSAGVPPELYPELKYYPENLPGVYNDPELAKRLKNIFIDSIGKENVIDSPASMGGEDFGRFGDTEHDIPISIYWLGSIDPSLAKKHEKGSHDLPSLHSSKYKPDPLPTLKTGIKTMSDAAKALLGN